MYCMRCGRAVPQTSNQCPACGVDLQAPVLVQRRSGLGYFLTQPLPFFGLLLAGLIVLVFLVKSLLVATGTPDPRKTVNAFLQEVKAKNRDKALNYLDPAGREQGLGFGVELVLQPNAEISYEDLKFELVDKNKERSQVRVTGKAIRTVDGKTQNIIFNTEVILVLQDKIWYLQPESLDRLFVL